MLTDTIKSTFKDAAQKLRGPAKRAFMANVTNDYFDGSSRKVENHLGWSRHTVHKGLKELDTGFVCLDNYAARGRKKTEETLPTLEADIHHLVQEQSLMRKQRTIYLPTEEFFCVHTFLLDCRQIKHQSQFSIMPLT